jgi:hypothetical protein
VFGAWGVSFAPEEFVGQMKQSDSIKWIAFGSLSAWSPAKFTLAGLLPIKQIIDKRTREKSPAMQIG